MNNLNLVNCEDIDDDLLVQFRHAASRLAERLRTYRRHIADMQSEFDRLTTERDEWKRDAGKLAESSVKAACVTRTRETIDGVECERISGLDVIVPVGLIQDGDTPKEVRSWRLAMPSNWLDRHGDICRATGDMFRESPGVLAILLADKPATEPAPTWTPPASLPDGYYSWELARTALLRLSHGATQWADYKPASSYRDWIDPTHDGVWHNESGRATYLGPNQESTQ